MAAGGIASNVTLGPGRLYVAPIGTAEPTDATSPMPSAWRPIGYTEQGTGFTTETTSEPVEVAEELDPIRYVNTRRLSSVAFEMAEATRRNLALALNLGANADNDDTALEPLDPEDEVRIMIVWDSDDTPGATNRRWLFRQCYQSGQVELANRKAPQKRLIGVNFRLEKPDGAAAYKIFPNASGLI